MPPLALFLLQSILVVGVPYAVWRLRLVRGWAPLVVVQIAFGVAMGPSLLGRYAPEVAGFLFPLRALEALDGLVWLAVTFFTFTIGLHFDLAEIRGRGRAFAVTSVATVAVPTLAGTLAGLAMVRWVPQALGPAAEPWTFAVGIGIAIGVTALPVLAAILREMHAMKSPLGIEALGCAAVNDAALWVMVAGLVAYVRGGGPGGVAVSVMGAGLYAAFMCCGVRRLLAHAIRAERVNERDMVLLAVGLMISALVTEMIGLSALVGGFFFGAVVPKAVARDVLARLEPFLMVVLLPFFFIATGLKADFHLGSGAGAVFVLALAVSVTAKLASAALPARAFGRPWPDALALGALVGAKGLMELVVLTALKDAGIISPVAFAGMVLMALATTALARPLTAVFLSWRH
ncbi:MAG: cation:proton antiporter [Solirubrobacterales bacterium]